MHVTVVVCTWNRCELLRQTLGQMTRLTVPDRLTWELLVINNNSTDSTDDVIAEFSAKLPLRRVFEPQPGLSRARNRALVEATGDYVLFTDDDVLVDGSWLVELAAASERFPDAAAIGGTIEPWFSQDPDPVLLALFPALRAGFCGLDYEREPGPLHDEGDIFGANMAYRISEIRGLRFDPVLGVRPSSTMGGEETDFLRRLRAAGGIVLWWPAMRVRHYVPMSRMTVDYLLKFQAEHERLRILTMPHAPAASILGVPRWVWRQYASFQIRRMLSHVTPGGTWPPFTAAPAGIDASRRVRSLTWKREMARLQGLLAGFRQLSGRRTDADSGAQALR